MFKRILLPAFFVMAILTGCSLAEDVQGSAVPALTVQPTNMEAAPTTALTDQEAEPTVTTASQVNVPDPTETEASDPSSASPTQVQCSGVLTSPNQEGPYYLEGSPENSDLVDEGMSGSRIVISGGVYDQECNPIPGAKIDFWQADAEGVYDNVGYTLRGHVISDEIGGYTIRTIEPGPYTGRPPHIHVKVFAPDGRELLTTQLYFPGSEDSDDVRAAPDLLVVYVGTDDNNESQILFNFIVQSQ